MSYTGGTFAVQEFIKKYKDTGHLIDVYSEEWMTAHPEIAKAVSTQGDNKQDPRCSGHLLILFVDRYHDDLFEDLKNIYEPFKYAIDFIDYFNPKFIFINLNIKQIFCIGLGRKGSLFTYDLHQKAEFCQGMRNELCHIDSQLGIGENYDLEFLSLDYLNITLTLLNALEELGEAYNERDGFCCDFFDPDFDIKDFLDHPHEEDLYYFEDDEDGHSKNEVLQDYSLFNQCTIVENEVTKTIKHFFPGQDIEID